MRNAPLRLTWTCANEVSINGEVMGRNVRPLSMSATLNAAVTEYQEGGRGARPNHLPLGQPFSDIHTNAPLRKYALSTFDLRLGGQCEPPSPWWGKVGMSVITLELKWIRRRRKLIKGSSRI